MSSVTVYELADLWPASTDDPHAVFEGDEPPGQVGTYVIDPGQRVPASGWTSHAGAEVSVILEGELRLVTEDTDTVVGGGTMTVIPAGVEHWSENVGDAPARLVYAIFGEL